MKYTKETWKGSALLAPVPPTIVTCKSGDKTNALTIAWTGILNTIPPKTYISVRPERYSYNLIKESRQFVINLTTRQLVKACDWCGVKSGAQFDKFKEMGLETSPATQVDVPLLCDSPVNLECVVTDIIPLGSHDMFIADIVAINVAKELLDKEGRLQLEKADLVAYSHGEYYSLGEKLGSFGYTVRKKKKSPRKNTSTKQKKSLNNKKV